MYTSRAMHFHEQLAADVQEVLDTSALLEITEFDVFRMAYSGWFGEQAADGVIEPFFIDYMFNDAVPVWVRHFTRRVIRLKREGRLEPRQLGIMPKDYQPEMAAKGIRYLIIAVFWLTLLILLAHFTSRLWPEGQCFFPPCY